MSDIRRKIIIVDDNVANLAMGRNLLKSHYDVYLASSAAQMFEMFEKILPDLILLDIEMPEMDGYETIIKLKADKRFTDIPVIFLTAQTSEESELKGFELGAVDYINKPFSPPLLLKRTENQLLLVGQRETIQSHADNLTVIVSEKVGEVIRLQNAIIGTFADLVGLRDKFTGNHVARTKLYIHALINGLKATNVYKDEIFGWNIDSVLQSTQLHDIGKIAIPDMTLNKPGRFTSEEFEVMKTHVTIGIDAINRVISKTKEQDFLQHAHNIIGAHHEKWDGTGYPYGLKGKEIPLEGRLMAVADVYDALVSWRPYKEKMPHEQAKKIIQEGSGTHFDPAIVDVFLSVEKTFQQISSKSEHDEFVRLNLVTFTKDMEIGTPEIDAQHKELLDRLNSLVLLEEEEEVRMMLGFLEEYVVKHFRDEEALQKDCGYPKYEWHKVQHQLFVDEFQKLHQEFYDNGFSFELLFELINSVTSWVVTHIKSVDAEFGQYYQMQNL